MQEKKESRNKQNSNIRKGNKKSADQDRSAKFVEFAPLAIVEWDIDCKILAWNPEAENTFGFTKDEVLGRNFFEILIPDSEKIDVRAIVDSLVANKKTNNAKNQNLTKSGELITCLWYNTPLFNSNGDFSSVMSMARNITEYEAVQKEKEKANKNYERLINELHEGVAIVDINENFTFVNPGFEKMTGFKAIEVLGKNLSEFIPEAQMPKILKETEKRTLGKSSSYATKLTVKNGSIKDISVSASPWRNDHGEIIGSMALIADITSQVRANNELQRRYNFEKRIFNISSRFNDNDNFHKKVDESLIDIGELSKAESIFIVSFSKSQYRLDYQWGKPVFDSFITLDSFPMVEVISAIKQLAKNEHFFLKDSTQIGDELLPIKQYIETNSIKSLMGFPIYLGTNLYGFLGVQNINDTEKWSNNEFILLRNAGEILCNSIQRKLNEDKIKNLNTQLHEKTKEIEQVLYVTSHDIRSPLVNIIGFTKELSKSVDELNEYLSRDVLTDEDKENMNYLIHEDIPEVLKFINAGGDKIDKLMNSLLRLSRLGRTELELSHINCKIIINEIVESMEYQIQEKRIKVHVGEMPEIKTDRHLFTQIMTNLIDNAVKYYDENKESYIKIECDESNDEVLFSVEDNGLGIPDDRKEKVFEIFSRINPDKTEGEGIGLTVIKKSVERLNGALNLESEFGVGTTFRVLLNKQ